MRKWFSKPKKMNKIEFDDKLIQIRTSTESWRSKLDENIVANEFLEYSSELIGKVTYLIVGKTTSLVMQLFPDSYRSSTNGIVLYSYNRIIKENMLLSLHETTFKIKELIHAVIGDNYIERKNVDFSKYVLFSKHIAFLEAIEEANKQKDDRLSHLIGVDVVNLHSMFEKLTTVENKLVKYELLALDSKFDDATCAIFKKIHTLKI